MEKKGANLKQKIKKERIKSFKQKMTSENV